MSPQTLFPVLAALFLGLALWRYVQRRQWRGAVSTWAFLSLVFAAVALWLNLKA
jgi:predicted PurR-regulated permease PerM